MNIENGRRYSRRDILRGVSGALTFGGLAFLGLGACGEESSKTKDQTVVSGEIDLLKYFPNGEKPTASGSFETAGLPVEWYNFTTAAFDPEAAKAIYDFLQSLNLNSFDTTKGSKLATNPTNINKHGLGIDLFIIKHDMKLHQELQSTLDAMGIEISAFSVPDLQTNRMLSFIKVYPEGKQPQADIINKRSPQDSANARFFVEACQGLLNVTTQDPKYELITQEQICNSAGLGITDSQKGVSWGDNVRRATGFQSLAPSLDTRLLPLREGVYSSLPKVSPFR